MLLLLNFVIKSNLQEAHHTCGSCYWIYKTVFSKVTKGGKFAGESL